MNPETITILLGFLTLAGGQVATLLTLIMRADRQRKETNDRIDAVNKRFDDVDKRFDDVNRRFDDVNRRFDETMREMAEQRERMARLEGALDGFLAGRRDRDAA